MKKTLANCPLSEFLPAAYRLRDAFHTYYHLLEMDALRELYAHRMNEAADDAEKTSLSRDYMNEILRRMMVNFASETVEMIALIGFMTKEEADALTPDEALGLLIEMLRSERVMDFFISLERTAASGTDGILRTLILLRLSVSAADTSATASQNSTSGTNAKSSAGDTPESA